MRGAWVAAVGLLGCVAHRSGEAVRDVSFAVEGRSFPQSLWMPPSAASLRHVVNQRASSWQSLLVPGMVEPEWFDPGRADKDEERLEVWLNRQGWFDGRVLRRELTRHRPATRRMRTVSIRYVLELGAVSRTRTLRLDGLDTLLPALQSRLRASLLLATGKTFSSTDFEASLAALRAELQSSGFAFAAVSGVAEAWPEEHAVDVVIQIVPGRLSTFGPVRLIGVEAMPTRVVSALVTMKAGAPYDPRALGETRAGLSALQVFSAVEVIPDLAAPDSGVVPVLVRVAPTKTRRLKLGIGVAVETGKGTVFGEAIWEDTNLFHLLWHPRQTVSIGAAGVVAQTDLLDRFAVSDVTFAPVADARSSISIPHVIGPTISLDVDGTIQLGLEQGYRFFSPQVAPVLTWRPEPRFSASLGYRIRYFDYDFFVDTQQIVDSPLGLDVTDPYLLSMLIQRATWDGRDDPMAPTRGWFASLAVEEAGGPLGGNFNFVRSQAEVRGYRSVPVIAGWNPWLIVAGRMGAGVIAPYGDAARAGAPYAERLYLGGGTTVRGWAANRLGPTVDVVNTTTGLTESLPAGGYLDLFGNLELRKRVFGSLSVAAFTDVGRVWATPEEISMAGLQWSVGGGLRYATPIGPIRGDIGVRLGRGFPEQTPRWAIHFGLAEAF